MSFKRPKKINSQQRIRRLDHRLEIAHAQIRKIQSLRLWTGAATILGFVLSAIWPQLHLSIPTLVFFLAVFPLLVKISRNWNKHHRYLKTWRDFEARQENRRNGTYKAHPPDLSALDIYGVAADLDLFGAKSLFTQIDETFSAGGAIRLGSFMLKDPTLEEIIKRQALLKDLSASRWFFLRFRLSNPTLEEARFSSNELLNSIGTFPTPSLRLKLLLAGVMLAWVTSVALVILYPVAWALFVVANIVFLLNLGTLMSKGEGVLHYFSDLAPTFEILESDRTPSAVAAVCSTIRADRPAQRIRRFDWPLAALTVESHPLVYLLINFFLPWSALFSFMLVNQVAGVRRNLETFFAELEEVETLTSLAVLTTDQTGIFPSVTSEQELRGEQFFHPLIDKTKRVANDFGFSSSEKMILLTGSNMSGKSTFLRTLGINQVLANMGAPVFAANFTTFPYRVRSCIRVSDSIEQGFSYFYAEVQRLKLVLAAAANHPPVLYLIDEIFRGTNNRERLIGSQSVIKHLLTTPAIGFITTHDLELTQIADGRKQVHNYHFRDEARDNQMHFSYSLHDGPSPTTNALKIMKQAGLPIETI